MKEYLVFISMNGIIKHTQMTEDYRLAVIPGEPDTREQRVSLTFHITHLADLNKKAVGSTRVLHCRLHRPLSYATQIV